MNEKTLVITIPVGSLRTNCYIVSLPAAGECIIIDPGEEPERISRIIRDKKLKPTMIINTHGHFDHTGGNKILCREFAIPLYSGKEGVLTLGDINFRVLATPGHTRDGISIYGDGKVFTGDALFAGDIGRSDLLGGSECQLLESIRGKLLTLPDDTKVYPGHGSASTIGNEKRNNPYV